VRLARAYDEDDRHLRRLATAIAKFHVCKRFPGLAAEALEVLGGNGYVEESAMPRIYREAPLNSVCSCATLRPRWPMRSAPRGWPATAG
jgi:putative acyl-CoA dehydrogenase